jgi:5-methylcytosine-specific restriction endonuclease McrA
MHFIDRNQFTEAPIQKLKLRHAKEQSKWLAKITWQNTPKADRSGTEPSKPGSHWNEDAKDELAAMFKSNCGYCGKHAGVSRDGQVDHHFPKSKDIDATQVYDWCNYVWSCGQCNSKKSNHYPILNPCCKTEMGFIYFNEKSGKYLCYSNTTPQIEYSFDETVKWTHINEPDICLSRKVFAENISRTIKEIRSNLFKSKVALPNKLDEAINKLKDLLTLVRKNYLWLASFLIEDYKTSLKDADDFPFSIDDFIT